MRSIKVIIMSLLMACLAIGVYGMVNALAADNSTVTSFSLPQGLNVWDSPGLQPIKMDIGMPDTNDTNVSINNLNASPEILAHNISIGAPGMSANITSSSPHANNTTPTFGSSGSNNTTAESNTTVPTHHPGVNPRSTKDQIQNMSDLERMNRNAFIGSTMHMAYEGTVQSPTWIDPFGSGRGVFNQINLAAIIDLAHSETLPGKHLAPVFWDL